MGRARKQDNDAFYLLNICDELLGAPGSREHRFEWLVGDASPKTGHQRRLPVDSYWAPLGLVIEVMESQHYEPTKHFDKPDVLTGSGVHRGIQRRIYDERRAEMLPKHGLTLLVLPISQFATRRKKILRDPMLDTQTVRRVLQGAGFATT